MGAVELYRGKRESYYVYRVDLPPDARGKRRQQRVTRDRKTGQRWTSKKACRTAMQAHEVELRTGVAIELTDMTVAAYMAHWLDDAAARVSPGTAGIYRRAWAQLEPHLGGVSLQSLQTLAIQQAVRTLQQRYAPKTVNTTMGVLKSALRQAVRWRLLAANPADGISLPKAVAANPRRVWTVDQARLFLTVSVDDPLHALWRLILDTGVRIGEAIALGWQHVEIDGDAPHVRVTRTMVRLGSSWEIGDAPKTASGVRVLTIAPETAAALRRYREAQDARCARCGPHWLDTGLVFDRGDGEPLPYHAAMHALARACRVAGVPELSPHELRHTMATLAAEQGVSIKLIADRLGHRGVDLVVGLYAHSSADGDRAVADALRKALNDPI